MVAARGDVIGGHGLGALAAFAYGAGSQLVFSVDEVDLDVPLGEWRPEVTGGDYSHPWRWKVSHRDVGTITIVDVTRPGADVAGPWRGLRAPQLRAAFRDFEGLLGVPWTDATGHTVERLILSTHPREKGGVLLDRDPQCPAPALGSTLELPYNWRRNLTGEELGRSYVHAFDANAQYLAAWGSAELGFGQVTHVDERAWFDSTLVGIWRVPDFAKVIPPNRMGPYAEQLVPPPWLEGREWFTTATLTRVQELIGQTVLVDEAYTWERKTRFLRGAGEKLRDARESITDELALLSDVGQMLPGAETKRAVLQAIKDCYRMGTGRFGWEGRQGSPWYRPDWGHAVRATARVNLHRRLLKLTRLPFAIATDGLVFASDDPDGLRFAETIGLPIGRGLGTFTHDGTARLEFVVRAGTAPAVFKAIAANRIEVAA